MNPLKEAILSYINTYTTYTVNLPIAYWDHDYLWYTIKVSLPDGITPNLIEWNESFYQDYYTDEELFMLCLEHVNGKKYLAKIMGRHNHKKKLGDPDYMNVAKIMKAIDYNARRTQMQFGDYEQRAIEDYRIGQKRVPPSGIKILRICGNNFEYQCGCYEDGVFHYTYDATYT